jgi:single-strand DNA-binding protein
MNRICLSGNICKDLEIKYTKNNKMYLENTIAVRKDRKDSEGNYSSDFINFVCFEPTSKFLKDYSKKGDKIELDGQLRVDSWKDDTGSTHTKTYVVAEKVNILTARNTNEKSENSTIKTSKGDYEITEEDLPF